MFFASGAAALMFEAAWFHRASLVLGTSVWAASLVLSSFMAGLALGSAILAWGRPRIARPLATYALLEGVVAATGLAITAVLPSLAGVIPLLTAAADGNAAISNAVRFAVAFALLLVPATAMGATLPLLVGAACRCYPEFGRMLGRLYGWNTLGAVAGLLLAEIVVIQAVGISGSAMVAAALNLLAAAMAWSLSRHAEVRPIEPPVEAGQLRTVPGWMLTAAAMLAGATLLGLEVLWFRFLSMYVLTTTLAMNMMLAVVLASIGAGSLFAASWLRRRPHAAAAVPGVALAAAAAAALSYVAFGRLTAGAQVADGSGVLWFAFVLTGPTSLLSGALFTLLGQALAREVGHDTRAAAWLTLANTIGAMAGPLVAGFVLLPVAGLERSFQIGTAVYGLVALFAILAQRTAGAAPARLPAGIVTAGALIAVLAVLSGGRMGAYVQRIALPYAADGAAVVAIAEGPSETIFLMQQSWFGRPVYSRLVTNGFSMSGTAIPAERYMRYFVYWPMLMRTEPIRRVLVICYGVGVTAGAATDLPDAETIDVVEISRDILRMSDRIYSPAEHPLRDPRVHVHVEDGRYFLATTDRKYDLITGEPPPPRTPGAVNIYTREYFRLLRERLSEGGIATYWLPVARPAPGTDVNTIIRAFCDVFEDCSLWNATPFDFMLVGSRNGGAAPTRQAMARAWGHGRLGDRLREVGFERPEQIGATFLADAADLDRLTGGTPPLTDDFPQRLRPSAGRPSLSDPRYASDPAASEMYQALIEPGRARKAFAASADIRRRFPASLIDETLPFFDVQGTINRVLWEGGRPLRQIEDLYQLQTATDLQTLPLWILGSDATKQTIGEGAEDDSGAAEYARALGALAARDYAAAAAAFSRAEQQGLNAPTVRPLLVYALCLDGQLDAARGLGRNADLRDPDARHFWSWIGPAFGVGPFAERR